MPTPEAGTSGGPQLPGKSHSWLRRSLSWTGAAVTGLFRYLAVENVEPATRPLEERSVARSTEPLVKDDASDASRAMLGKRMSLEEIVAHLNAQKVLTIHGTNRWTASSVRQAFVS